MLSSVRKKILLLVLSTVLACCFGCGSDGGGSGGNDDGGNSSVETGVMQGDWEGSITWAGNEGVWDLDMSLSQTNNMITEGTLIATDSEGNSRIFGNIEGTINGSTVEISAEITDGDFDDSNNNEMVLTGTVNGNSFTGDAVFSLGDQNLTGTFNTTRYDSNSSDNSTDSDDSTDSTETGVLDGDWEGSITWVGNGGIWGLEMSLSQTDNMITEGTLIATDSEGNSRIFGNIEGTINGATVQISAEVTDGDFADSINNEMVLTGTVSGNSFTGNAVFSSGDQDLTGTFNTTRYDSSSSDDSDNSDNSTQTGVLGGDWQGSITWVGNGGVWDVEMSLSEDSNMITEGTLIATDTEGNSRIFGNIEGTINGSTVQISAEVTDGDFADSINNEMVLTGTVRGNSFTGSASFSSGDQGLTGTFSFDAP